MIINISLHEYLQQIVSFDYINCIFTNFMLMLIIFAYFDSILSIVAASGTSSVGLLRSGSRHHLEILEILQKQNF